MVSKLIIFGSLYIKLIIWITCDIPIFPWAWVMWVDCPWTQAWWHLGRNGSVAAWGHAGRPQSAPWKKKPAKPSLLRKIPGGEDPFRIRCDLAHIWAIGVGKEFVGSALILLAGELQVWPGRSIGTRLEVGYSQFRSWCHLQNQWIQTENVQDQLASQDLHRSNFISFPIYGIHMYIISVCVWPTCICTSSSTRTGPGWSSFLAFKDRVMTALSSTSGCPTFAMRLTGKIWSRGSIYN